MVGKNESGKSTLLEAIALALTKRLNGRPLDLEMSPYLFNRSSVATYVDDLRNGRRPAPPRISIELTFDEDSAVAALMGTNNHDGSNACGVRLNIELDEACRDEYERLISVPQQVNGVPVELYKTAWMSFADKPLTTRGVPVKAAHIDAASMRFHSGAAHFVQTTIQESLSPEDQITLRVEYRRLKELFAAQPGIQAINETLKTRHSSLSDHGLAVGMDMSQRAPWEANLMPYLNETPLQFAGKGEQHAIKIMFALDREVADCQVLLIEEPENHLAFGHMNILINRIAARCAGRQVFISTHSAFVLNKLGLENTILLRDGLAAFLSGLPADTQEYFRKLPGYDTLRLILAKKTILVEGPSDELFVQKAFRQRHGKLPIAAGIDVLSVRGLSFPRFLDVAKAVGHPTAVVTDNDGDFATTVAARYAGYAGVEGITVHADPDNSRPTLEDHVLEANGLAMMNHILGRRDVTEDALHHYMVENKTEWALKVFDHPDFVRIPAYVEAAVA